MGSSLRLKAVTPPMLLRSNHNHNNNHIVTSLTRRGTTRHHSKAVTLLRRLLTVHLTAILLDHHFPRISSRSRNSSLRMDNNHHTLRLRRMGTATRLPDRIHHSNRLVSSIRLHKPIRMLPRSVR